MILCFFEIDAQNPVPNFCRAAEIIRQRETELAALGIFKKRVQCKLPLIVLQAAELCEISYGILCGRGSGYGNFSCQRIGKHLKIAQIHDGLDFIFAALIKAEFTAAISIPSAHRIACHGIRRQIPDRERAGDAFELFPGDAAFGVIDIGLEVQRL